MQQVLDAGHFNMQFMGDVPATAEHSHFIWGNLSMYFIEIMGLKSAYLWLEPKPLHVSKTRKLSAVLQFMKCFAVALPNKLL